MTTTTIISPSPTRLSIPPLSQSQTFLSTQQHPMEQHMGEKFPSFEDTRSDLAVHPVDSPEDSRSPVNPLLVSNWPVRNASRAGWENHNGTRYKHQPKRSVSEALGNFRQRRGSIAANTHVLAEALKAPISYKLIVSSTSIHSHTRINTNNCMGAMYCLVYDIGPHEYVL